MSDVREASATRVRGGSGTRRAPGSAAAVAVWHRLRTWFLRHPDVNLWLVVALVYVLTASYFETSVDVLAAEEPASAFAATGSLDLAGMPHADLPWYFHHASGLYSDRFPGAIAYLVPMYWLCQQMGLHLFTLIPGVLTAAYVTATAVTLLRRVYVAVLPNTRRAWIATWFTAFGTGAWSICANAPWSHTLDVLLIAVALALFSRGRMTTGALVLGLLVPVRPTMVVACAAFGLSSAWLGRSLRPIVVGALGTLPGVALLFVYNGLLFGRWGPSNGHELEGDIHVRWGDLPINIVGAVVSPTRGLIVFYPVLLLLIVTGAQAWRSAAVWERSAAVAGVAVLITQLSLNRYSGGEGFYGPRLVLETLTFGAPLLARAASLAADNCQGSRSRRWWVPVCLGAGVMIHAMGALVPVT